MSADKTNPCVAPKIFIKEQLKIWRIANLLAEIIAAMAAMIIVTKLAKLKNLLDRSNVLPSCWPIFSIL